MRLCTFAAIVVIVFSATAFSQQESNAKQSTTHTARGRSIPIPLASDSVRISMRPEITLQKALALAESYIREEHICIEKFFLLSAGFINYGPEKGPKEPMWYFWWVNENGALGDYVELIVSMKGKVRRLGSM